jgi:hypothetical protein
MGGVLLGKLSMIASQQDGLSYFTATRSITLDVEASKSYLIKAKCQGIVHQRGTPSLRIMPWLPRQRYVRDNSIMRWSIMRWNEDMLVMFKVSLRPAELSKVPLAHRCRLRSLSA